MSYSQKIYGQKKSLLGTAALLLTAVVALLSLLIADAHANQFKRIRDVNVSCNNALRCNLFVANPRVTLSTFGLRRSAAPDAPVSVVLGTREAFASGSQLVFSVDGSTIGSIDVSALSYRAAVSEYTFRDEGLVSDIIAASKAGAELQISYRSRLGASSASFGLSGFIAGLIFMDEVQERVGNADALHATQATDLMPLRTAQGFSTIDGFTDVPLQVRTRYFAGTQSSCSGLTDFQRNNLGGLLFDLGESRLLAIPCGAPGAYNTGFAFFSEIAGRYQRVSVPMIDGLGISTVDVAFNISFNPSNATLTAYYKGRGVGDCGTLDTFEVVTGSFGAPTLRLLEARHKSKCDGQGGDPEAWPLVWSVAGE